MDFQLGHKKIGSNQPVLIIAEAGINHDGDIGKAKELIWSAAEAGADVIKFQTHMAQHEMVDVSDRPVYLNESLFSLIQRVSLSRDDHCLLMKEAQKAGLLFLSTPFSVQAVDLLEGIGIAGFKIGSGELTNHPFLEYVAARGRPVFMSTGMSRLEEVDLAVNIFLNAGCKIALFQCTSEYPTKPEHTRLNVIKIFQDRYNIPIGFSDHSVDNYSAFAAVALGARLVEKHFTISRKWPGPDQSSSIEPEEMMDLIAGIRVIEKGLQSKAKELTDTEEGIRKVFSASVVSIEGIAAGATFTKENIWVKRPGTGIPASEFKKVIGKKAKRHIQKEHILSSDDIEW